MGRVATNIESTNRADSVAVAGSHNQPLCANDRFTLVSGHSLSRIGSSGKCQFAEIRFCCALVMSRFV